MTGAQPRQHHLPRLEVFPQWKAALWPFACPACPPRETTTFSSQMPDWKDPLCSQSWHNLRWTSHFLWPNIIIIQIWLLSHPCTSLYPSVSWLQNCQYYCHIYRSLQTWLLQFTIILQSTKFTNKSTSTNSKLSCSHCCQISQVLIHHSCNQVSALVKGQGTYWVQASLSHLQTYYYLSAYTYLSKLVTVQFSRSTRSSSVVTISRPPTSSSLKITNLSFNMRHPSFGINSLTLSVSLIHILVFHLLTTYTCLLYTSDAADE